MKTVQLIYIAIFGLLFACAEQDKPEESTAKTETTARIKPESFIRKSSIFFTQPLRNEISNHDHGKYTDYHVDATMWGFLPPSFTNFDFQTNLTTTMNSYVTDTINHDLADVGWVSRIEWDVIWNGMTSKYPQTFQQAMVKRLDGSSLEIKWFPGHYFFSTHHPLFREYIEWQIQDVAFYDNENVINRVDAILFDSQHSNPAQYYLGGDFSEHCMANFNTWLVKNFSNDELIALGITNISTFHYGDFLKTAGYTAAQYEAETTTIPNKIPLNNEYRHFLQDWNNSYLAELVQYTDEVAKAKGYPYQEGVGYIEVGTSSPILDPYWNGIRMPFNDEFDFYVQEFNHRATEQKINGDVMLMYKLAEAINKPLALTALPYPDWNYMVDHPEAVDLVRTWIALAYANGQIFMAPEHMWAYQGALQRYYDPAIGDYDYIYAWINEKSLMFDGYETVANVGLVYSHKAYRETQYDELDVFLAASDLMEQNIPYKLLVAGDSWWPKYLTDSDQSHDMDNFNVIVKTDFNGATLSSSQTAKLNYYRNKVVKWSGKASITDLLPKEVAVDVAQVALFPRENPTLNATMSNAPRIMHLVNRDYNAITSSLNPKTNLTVTINDSLYTDVTSGFVGATYTQAGQSAIQLDISYENGITSVKIPELKSWGLIELYPLPFKVQ
ncbi:hypothetical protein RI845_18435 [Thalassotalea nanhaiensis]|uniref:Uncharacterized protein n=1 Tax=Thalassotalea nanhaiensis TaxID=3065648 RepID=A0ABY9TL36_9GAMM|nr:hypothetical protein RI845_18435 [Colwelliaceae bacterium SQ345]